MHSLWRHIRFRVIGYRLVKLLDAYLECLQWLDIRLLTGVADRDRVSEEWEQRRDAVSFLWGYAEHERMEANPMATNDNLTQSAPGSPDPDSDEREPVCGAGETTTKGVWSRWQLATRGN